MKRNITRLFTGFLCTAILATGFIGCGTNKTNDLNSENNTTSIPETEKLSIISTVFPGYDFATQICGEGADISILVPLGMSTHSYEPAPQDIIAIQNCDLFIYVGAESEAWVTKILDSLDKPINTFVLTDQVPLLPIEPDDHDEDDHDEDDHDEDDHHHTYDEHVWTSPPNAATLTQKLAISIGRLDPTNKTVYQQNADAYVQTIHALDQQFYDFFEAVENKTMVFGDQFPLRYFAEEYGLTVHSAFSGCSTDSEISPSTLKELIDLVKVENLATVFYMEFSNSKIADTIAEQSGATTARLHSAHNISKDEKDQGVTYVSLMKNNLNVLREAMR